MQSNQVVILLSTYNGEKYLEQQLSSLFSQSHKNIKIIARDDGSCDNTLYILKSYNNIQVLDSSKNTGIKKSFSILLEFAIKNTNSEYFMFCDQDDVWNIDKIEKSFNKIQELNTVCTNLPLVVHTDLEVVDENLNEIDKSMWNYEHISPNKNKINNLLFQNTITGCTMIINRKLATLSSPIPDNCIMHDWWMSLVASAFGEIYFINESTIKYRQHSSNDTGARKFNFIYVLKKIYNLILGYNTNKYILQAKSFLKYYEDKLDDDMRPLFVDFCNIQNKSFFEKRRILLKYKLLKQSLIKNIGLFLIL